MNPQKRNYKTIIPFVITNGHFNKEKTLKEVKRANADAVALAIEPEEGYYFSSPKSLKLIGECVEYYKENGLGVYVWLGESFGHSTVFKQEKKTGKYLNRRFIADGKYVDCRCTLDEEFIKDCQEWVREVAKCKPDLILWDDDFRLSNNEHGLGCCCEKHMQKICLELGETIDVPDLCEKVFLGGKNRYRDAWIKAQEESANYFSKRMREALDEVDKSIRMGACTASTAFDGGIDLIERAKILAGNTQPFIRLLGAPYISWNCSPSRCSLGEIIEIERTEFAWCKEYQDMEIVSEGDTYPRPRYTTPAAYIECFDMILRADQNTGGILKYIMDYHSDADYERGYVDFAERNQPIYAMIDELFFGKTVTGVNPVSIRKTFERAVSKSCDKRSIELMTAHFNNPCNKLLATCTIPTAHGENGVNVIFGDNALYVDENILSQGNIIDLKAAEILMQRGIDVGIRKIGDFIDAQGKGFGVLPNQYFKEEEQYVRLEGWAGQRELELDARANVQTEYVLGSDLNTRYTGIFSYTNAKGQRFTVLPVEAQAAADRLGYFTDYAMKRLLMKNINASQPLDGYILGDFPYLYMMTAKDENSLSVGIWDLSVDRADGVEVTVNGEYKNVQFYNCKGTYKEGKIYITSTIYPYEFAGILLTK